jgi:glycosyltransferase involved in cell wall biosynthesis
MKRSIHVFSADFLQFPGQYSTAAGARGMQIVSALREAGHKVTCSMPLTTYPARCAADVVSKFTDEERWCSEHFFEPDIVLARIQPEIAVHGHVEVFRSVRRFPADIVHILDLNGPVHLESEAIAGRDGTHDSDNGSLKITERCRSMIEHLRNADYIMTVSERQKYFWLAYCSLAGFSISELNALVCPFSFSIPNVERNPSPRISIVHAGAFYPWQMPDRFLREAADFLDNIEGAELNVVGEAHRGLPNEAAVNALLRDLKQHRSVRCRGFCSFEEVTKLLSTSWAALDLMEQTLERELAVNGRTLHYLLSGTPVVYNNYSTLSASIDACQAGWAVPVDKPGALGKVLDELVEGGLPLVRRLSDNALRLGREELAPGKLMAPLVELCGGPLGKRHKPSAGRRVRRVFAISGDTNALLELRVRNPLRSLQKAGVIDEFVSSGFDLEKLKGDPRHFDAIWIQRCVPELIYCALENNGIPFLMDVDDNLLAAASYRRGATEDGIVTGLARAAVVTAPNPRLIQMLEKYSRLELRHKAFMTPNSLPFPESPREPRQPSQIIWIQSDIAALDASREDVVRAVDDFSSKYALPVVLIGRNVLERPRFKHQVVLGQIDFEANLDLLASAPTSIGVAPLETSSDEQTLDFVAGKSDLKILLFAGYGHPGIYSASPPYTDSPLQTCCSVIGNSYREWMEALEYEYRDGWRRMDQVERRIREERNCDRVGPESWTAPVEACLFPRPIRGADLYEILQSVTAGLNGAAPRINDSMARAMENEIQSLRKQVSEIRSSYSWKITAPLRTLARPMMERRRP